MGRRRLVQLLHALQERESRALLPAGRVAATGSGRGRPDRAQEAGREHPQFELLSRTHRAVLP